VTGNVIAKTDSLQGQNLNKFLRKKSKTMQNNFTLSSNHNLPFMLNLLTFTLITIKVIRIAMCYSMAGLCGPYTSIVLNLWTL